jgi:hypothetical protein
MYYSYAKGSKYRDTKILDAYKSKRRKRTNTIKADCYFFAVAKKCLKS